MLRFLRAFDVTDDVKQRPAVCPEKNAGGGISKGIDYTYSLHSSSLFGHYQCRVHKRLLDSYPIEFLSQEFDLNGFKWQLKLVTRRNGQLSVYLLSKNKSPVTAHFSFTLANHLDPKKSVIHSSQFQWGTSPSSDLLLGWSTAFEPFGLWGVSRFASIVAIKTPGSGFLFGNGLDVSVKIRMKSPENEEFSAIVCGTSCTCTWKLREARDSSPYALKSGVFSIGVTQWYVSLLPNGTLEDSRQCSAFLYCLNDFSIRAKFRLTVLNHRSHRRDHSRELVHEFLPGLDSRGWTHFMPKRTIRNPKLGFLEYRWVTLIAQISVEEDPHRISLHADANLIQSDKPDEDQVQLEEADERPVQSDKAESSPLCVICLDNEQTSGFVHGKTTHKCVCAKCCELIYKTNFNCPICAEHVDSIIFGYF